MERACINYHKVCQFSLNHSLHLTVPLAIGLLARADPAVLPYSVEVPKWLWCCALNFKVCHCNRLCCVVLKLFSVTFQILTHENTPCSFDSRNFWEMFADDCVSALRGHSLLCMWKDSKVNYPACLSLICVFQKELHILLNKIFPTFFSPQYFNLHIYNLAILTRGYWIKEEKSPIWTSVTWAKLLRTF